MRALFVVTLMLSMLGVPQAVAAAADIVIEPTARNIDQVIRLSPPNLQLEAAAGRTLKTELVLANQTSKSREFTLKASDAVGSSDPSLELDVLPGVPKDAGTWVRLPATEITVPALSVARITIRIVVPATPKPGSHSLAVSASSASKGATGGGLDAVLRLTSVITLDLRGTAKVAGRVSSLRIRNSSPRDLAEGRGEAEVVLTNTGARVLNFRGTLEARNLLGNVVAKYPMPPLTVYPDGRSGAKIPLRNLTDFGIVQLRVKVDARGLGPRTESSRWLLVLPAWWPAIAGFLGFVIVGGVLRRRARHRRMRAHAEPD